MAMTAPTLERVQSAIADTAKAMPRNQSSVLGRVMLHHAAGSPPWTSTIRPGCRRMARRPRIPSSTGTSAGRATPGSARGSCFVVLDHAEQLDQDVLVRPEEQSAHQVAGLLLRERP